MSPLQHVFMPIVVVSKRETEGDWDVVVHWDSAYDHSIDPERSDLRVDSEEAEEAAKALDEALQVSSVQRFVIVNGTLRRQTAFDVAEPFVKRVEDVGVEDAPGMYDEPDEGLSFPL